MLAHLVICIFVVGSVPKAAFAAPTERPLPTVNPIFSVSPNLAVLPRPLLLRPESTTGAYDGGNIGRKFGRVELLRDLITAVGPAIDADRTKRQVSRVCSAGESSY